MIYYKNSRFLVNFRSKTADKSARGHFNSKLIFGVNLHRHKYICTTSGALVTKNEFSMKKLQISLVFSHFRVKMPQNAESK